MYEANKENNLTVMPDWQNEFDSLSDCLQGKSCDICSRVKGGQAEPVMYVGAALKPQNSTETAVQYHIYLAQS